MRLFAGRGWRLFTAAVTITTTVAMPGAMWAPEAQVFDEFRFADGAAVICIKVTKDDGWLFRVPFGQIGYRGDRGKLFRGEIATAVGIGFGKTFCALGFDACAQGFTCGFAFFV